MKNYELNYLISSDLTEEEAKVLQEKVASFIQEEEGILNEKGNPVKKRLAYPIEKQLQAYLVFLTFQLEPEKLASLKRKVEEEKEILRYLLIIKLKAEKTAAPRRRRPELTPKVIKKTTEEKKVELKEIDKKLEEILE